MHKKLIAFLFLGFLLIPTNIYAHDLEVEGQPGAAAVRRIQEPLEEVAAEGMPRGQQHQLNINDTIFRKEGMVERLRDRVRNGVIITVASTFLQELVFEGQAGVAEVLAGAGTAVYVNLTLLKWMGWAYRQPMFCQGINAVFGGLSFFSAVSFPFPKVVRNFLGGFGVMSMTLVVQGSSIVGDFVVLTEEQRKHLSFDPFSKAALNIEVEDEAHFWGDQVEGRQPRKKLDQAKKEHKSGEKEDKRH